MCHKSARRVLRAQVAAYCVKHILGALAFFRGVTGVLGELSARGLWTLPGLTPTVDSYGKLLAQFSTS